MTAKACRDAVYSTFCAFPAKVVSSSLAFMAGHAVRMINHNAALITRVSQDRLAVTQSVTDSIGQLRTFKEASTSQEIQTMVAGVIHKVPLSQEDLAQVGKNTAETVTQSLVKVQHTLDSLGNMLPAVPGAVEWATKLSETACKADLLLLTVTMCTDSAVDFANELLKQKRRHFSWPVIEFAKFGVAAAVCVIAESFFPLSGVVKTTGMTLYTAARVIALIGRAAFDRSKLEGERVRRAHGSTAYYGDDSDQPGAPPPRGSEGSTSGAPRAPTVAALTSTHAPVSTGGGGGGEREGETAPPQAPPQYQLLPGIFPPVQPSAEGQLQAPLPPAAAASAPPAAARSVVAGPVVAGPVVARPIAAQPAAKAASAPSKAGAPAAAGAAAKKTAAPSVARPPGAPSAAKPAPTAATAAASVKKP